MFIEHQTGLRRTMTIVFLGDPAVQKHQVWCGDHLHCEEDHAVQKVTTSLAVKRLCDGNDKEICDYMLSAIAKPPI